MHKAFAALMASAFLLTGGVALAKATPKPMTGHHMATPKPHMNGHHTPKPMKTHKPNKP